MIVFKWKSDLMQHLNERREGGSKIGFVPTMGALHAGHISLLQRSMGDGCYSVTSIFVNPTQFNNAEDLDKYPRTSGADIALLEAAGCDVLYMPEVADIYDGKEEMSAIPLGGMDTLLEGASRPGHFAGVAGVVRILLEAVGPDKLYMGQKDYQQTLVVQKMLEHTQSKVQLVRCPIVREDNGLAMSSRNVRLSPEMREHACCIYQTMVKAAAQSARRELPVIEQESKEHLNSQPGYEVDYFGFYDAMTLEPLRHLPSGNGMVLLTAVWVNGVRLLDNILVQDND